MSTQRKAYKFRFYPTEEQKEQLGKTFGCTRFVYNYFLEKKREAWKEKQRLNYSNTAELLKNLKKELDTIWLNEVSSVCLQQSLRALDTAYQNFFSKRSRYPKKKKKRGKQSARYMRNAFSWKDGKLILAKQKESLDIRWSRELPNEEPSSVTVSQDPSGRYFVSLLVEEEITSLKSTKQLIGIDLGISHSVIASDGKKIENPKYLEKSQARLRLQQKILSRKKLGSKNREKQRKKVARIHAKVSDQRRDFHHKVSTQLVRENQAIAAETLAVKSMLKDKRLSKSISDSGWRQLLNFLEYKAKWYGRSFLAVDKWFPSSKRCSQCGHTLEKLALSCREWSCPSCAKLHDRDVNAAKNILWKGLEWLQGKSIEATAGRAGCLKPVESV